MDTSYWSPWPGTLSDWQANWIPAGDDPGLPTDWLSADRYFQLATRPMFQLLDNEPLTEKLRTRASLEQIRLFAVYVSDNDINNGRFWQWLGNSYSCLYPSLLEGHRMLGLPQIADLIEDTVALVFPDHDLPLDHDARNRALDALIATPRVDRVVDQLSQRDRIYFQPQPGMGYRGSDELSYRICHFIDQHPDRFFTHATA